MGWKSRVLHRDAAALEHPGEQEEALGGPRADDDGLGIGDNAADSAQVLGEGTAQLDRAARVRIAERPVGCIPEGAPQRAQPRLPREVGEVGEAREEVERRHRDPLLGRYRRGGGPRRGYEGAGAGPCHQISLGEELAVRVDDQAAGYAQIRCKRPGRGQPRVRRQPAGANGLAQAVLKLRPHGPAHAPVQLEEQLRACIGTRFRAQSCAC